MENIILYSSKVYISENENPDSYIAKFVICDFSINKNNYGLNRATIDNWIDTLKNKPLVGKIKLRDDGQFDFTGHNLKKITKVDSNGNKYQVVEFDTSAFGTFIDVGIETIDNVEYIVATVEIWKRFTQACEIILSRITEGTLQSSWEISVVDSVKTIVNGVLTTIINAGRFLGHCLLGSNVEPAYNSSKLIQIASTDNDVDNDVTGEIDCSFAEALSNDIIVNLNINSTNITEKEEEILDDKIDNKIIEGQEDTDITLVSNLTEYDLRNKIRKACSAKLGTYCYIAFHFPVNKEVWVEKEYRESELDYVKFTYEVENDVITLSEPLDVKLTVSVAEVNSAFSTLTSENEEKTNAILKLNENLETSKIQISELLPYKEKFEQAESIRLENERKEKKELLISTYLKTKQITENEIETSTELQSYFEDLDVKSLNEYVVNKLIASLQNEEGNTENEEIETSSSNLNEMIPSTNLFGDEEVTDTKSIMQKYFLGGK